nr:glycosyltransferase [uncultured Holophaga sp.]
MKVLKVTDVYFPRMTGVCTAIQTYRSQLAAQGIETLLIAPDYGPAQDPPGTTRLPSFAAPFDHEDRLVRPGRFRRAALRLAEGCDLVHIHTPFSAHGAGLAAARRFGLPVVATYHTLFEEYLHLYARFLPRGFSRPLARHLSRRHCNQMDAVVVPSSAMAERLRSYGVTKPIHILPTGIPIERFARGDRRRFRAAQGIPEERPVALFLGRVAREKNLGFLLEAFRCALADCPELLLILAGEGPAEPELRSRIQSWGLEDSVRFLGNMDRVIALPDCLAGVDLFAFASKTETQGLVLLEAMAAGLPVVSLAEMGTRDILQPASGARVPEEDPTAFGSALAEVAQDQDLRSRMSEASRAWVGVWSDTALTARLADLYRKLIRERGERAALPGF